MRLGELHGVKWGDIDYDAGTLTITRQVHHGGRVGAPKTKRSRRTINLSSGVVDALQARWRDAMTEGNEGSPWVFPGIRGGTTDRGYWYAKSWRPARDAAELSSGVRFHDIRHTVISRLVAGGIDVVTVARLVWDRPEQTLKTYAHLQPGRMQAAADLVGVSRFKPVRQ